MLPSPPSALPQQFAETTALLGHLKRSELFGRSGSAERSADPFGAAAASRSASKSDLDQLCEAYRYTFCVIQGVEKERKEKNDKYDNKRLFIMAIRQHYEWIGSKCEGKKSLDIYSHTGRPSWYKKLLFVSHTQRKSDNADTWLIVTFVTRDPATVAAAAGYSGGVVSDHFRPFDNNPAESTNSGATAAISLSTNGGPGLSNSSSGAGLMEMDAYKSLGRSDYSQVRNYI